MQGSGVDCIKSHPVPSRILLFVGGCFVGLGWNRKRVQLGTILGIDIETHAVHRSAMLACLLAGALETKRAARSHVSVVPFIRSTISALLDKCSVGRRSRCAILSRRWKRRRVENFICQIEGREKEEAGSQSCSSLTSFPTHYSHCRLPGRQSKYSGEKLVINTE